MKPNINEIAILNEFKIRYNDPVLNQQIDNVSITKREYTGHGWLFNLEVNRELPKLDQNKFKKYNINGPEIEAEGIDYGGGSIIFQKNGYISLLELFAYGDNFSKDISSLRFLNNLEKK